MPVSYLSAIRSVLNTYPPSKALFREILQNSEDAKATTQMFVLDHRDSHAPALLAYNDSHFTESDFTSFFNLWDSSKKKDDSKIGKYGMGFRSTFHITDMPQVLSQSTLVMLDPLNDEQPDIRLQVNSAKKHAKIYNLFALHLFQPDVATSTFKGTVARLPLRQRPSEIATKVFSATDIQHLLSDFIQDQLRITLLFLNNVSSISIYEISPDGHTTCLAASSITRSKQTTLVQSPIPASFIDLTETTTINDTPQPPEHWRILHTSFSSDLASSTLSTRLGFDAAPVLAEHKLHPHLAIAANLSLLQKPETAPGRLFTYLPLPLFTRFCVHLHGLFALTPSREKLQNREEKPAHGTVYHISVEWNKLLFEEYLPKAWMCLLHMLAESEIHNLFDAWPPPQTPNQLGDSGYWEELPANLAENIIKSKSCVWPVVGSPGRFCGLENVIVAGGGTAESDEVIDALAACELDITRPPKYIVELLKDATLLTPAAAHNSLLNFKHTLASQDKLPSILNYLLSTDELEYIADLPVVPIPKGNYIALTHRNSSSTVRVLLESVEYELFKTCDSTAISLGYIDTHLASLLRRTGPTTLNVQPLTPLTVLAYLQTLLVPGAPVDSAWTSMFWLWLVQWPSKDSLYPSLVSLPLLPTQSGLQPLSSPIFEPTGIHPLLLALLKKLCLPFLHSSFGPSSAARKALNAFKAFSDVNDIDALLDALDLDAIMSFVGDEQAVQQLATHVSNRMLSSLHTNEDRRRKLRALPIFRVHPLASYQGQVQGQGQKQRIRIPEGYAVFKVDLRDLPFLPVLTDTVVLDASHSLSLIEALDPDSKGALDDIDVLSLCMTHFTSQPKATQEAIVKYMACHTRHIPRELFDILGSISFIVVGDGSLRPPREVIDPKSSLRALYSAGSRFLPHSDFQGKNLSIISYLSNLHLMQHELSNDTLQERIRHITTTQDQKCARKLVRVIYNTAFKLPLSQVEEIHNAKWLPTPKGLRKPNECRDDPYHHNLFDRVLSPLDDGLRTDDSFRATFCWDQPVSIEVMSQQLHLAAQDNAYTVVRDVVRELMERQLSDHEILRLKEAVAGHGWVPVAETSTLAQTEYAVFSDADSSVGFHQVMFPGPESLAFFTRMGCSKRPSTAAIITRLSDLENESPSLRVAKQARRLLSLLPDTKESLINRSQILVPDINCILRPLSSVFFNDIGDSAILAPLGDDEHMAHDVIHASLAKSLCMGRLGLKNIDHKSFGIDMGEQLITTIASKLRSYTPRQIMTEFIANASDAGATKFGVIIDEIIPPRNRIISSQLAEIINGPSLVLCNDSVFTEADFNGICQTGVGGKSSRRDSIGQFGFGALTMFHLADFAMIVSGESVLFIEPTKRLLPIKDRATLLLSLRHVKQMFPDHVKPLDGLFGFELSSSEKYQGTLFRLPLRRHVGNCSLGEAWDIHRLQKDIIKPFEDHAQEFLLFTLIRTIKVNHRTSSGTACTRMISLDLTEETTVNEFKTKVFDINIHSYIPRHATETQSWHIVSTSPPGYEEVSQLTKYRLRSPVTLAIAARTDTQAKKERRHVYKFFSSLPLRQNQLPVHISAPFILSDDRRQVRLDNLDPAAADYNRWLLSSVVPPLYLFLLSDLLEHEYDNVPWWPGCGSEEDEFTQLVTSSFYKTLKASHQRVFWPRYIDEPVPLTSGEVVLFRTLKDGDALHQVFDLLGPPVVLFPHRLLSKACVAAGLTQLKPAYLSDLIRQSSINVAEHLEFEELNELLIFLGQNADDLLDLRLLPLASGEFGVIKRASGASQSYLTAPESIYTLFPHGEQHLVHASFKSMSVLSQLRQTFNVKEMDGPSLKLLLATVLTETTVANHNANVRMWIELFWYIFAGLKVDHKNIDTFPLVPTTRAGVYTSIANCRDRSAVVLSSQYEDAWLWPTLASLGLTVVERYSEDLPRYLRNPILTGTDFSQYIPFTDFLSSMAAKRQVVLINFGNLDANIQKQFGHWCRTKLGSSAGLLPHLLAFARQLPIWPTYQFDDTLIYQSADRVTVLPPDIPIHLARRFLHIPFTPYSPCFVTLKKEVLSFPQFFGSLNLPPTLSENDVVPYKELLTMFLENSRNLQSVGTLRVPDANLVLRHPRDLYAHDRLFISSFEGSPEFILDSFLDLEPRLLTFGMKREANLDVNMFTACARALANANSVSDVNPERARIVFEAYCEVLPFRITSHQKYLWTTLDVIRFIPRDPSRRRSELPMGLDPAIYAKPLPVIVSPSEVMLQEFEPIVWTQRAHFLHPPGERIHIANPSFGRPSFFDVVEHWKTLALRILRDFPSSRRLCHELVKTYEWLNDNCDEESNTSLLVTLHAEPLFLNVTDPTEFATWEWHTADQLLLNETRAVSRFHPVKAFLLTYKKLLHAAGVKAVVHPKVPPSLEGPSDSDQLALIRKAFQEMRRARKLTDVKFITAGDDEEEEILPCHRTCLATYSSFFYDAFTNEMEPANLEASVRNPKTINVRDYSSRCVSCALDFAYTGTIDNCSEDLQLMIEILKLSDFWIMNRLHEEIQRLIVSKKLINIETCQKIEEIAQRHQASFLSQQCQEYRDRNTQIM